MIHVATRTQDFLYALGLWTSVAPYRDFPAKSVGFRLTPAFLRGKLLILSRDGRRVGFCTWGWMTTQEYDSRKYYGPAVFARVRSDRLVVPDIITTDTHRVARELGRFFRSMFPDVSRVYSWREQGRRDAVYCIGRPQ